VLALPLCEEDAEADDIEKLPKVRVRGVVDGVEDVVPDTTGGGDS